MTNDPTGQVRHWLEVVSFDPSSISSSSAPGTAGTGLPITTVKELTAYLPCTPGVGSGKHRYVFLLCQQGTATSEGTATKVGGDPEYLGQGFITKNAPNEDLKDRMGFIAEK